MNILAYLGVDILAVSVNVVCRGVSSVCSLSRLFGWEGRAADLANSKPSDGRANFAVAAVAVHDH